MKALRIAAGPLLWALHFTLLYGVTSLACARGFAGVVPWTIALATLALALPTVAVIARAKCGDFVDWLTAALAGISLLAIVLQAVPVLVVPACA